MLKNLIISILLSFIVTKQDWLYIRSNTVLITVLVGQAIIFFIILCAIHWKFNAWECRRQNRLRKRYFRKENKRIC